MVHPDVLIIGGGVIGLTTAWYLAEAGASVCVVDQADFGQQASRAGAGILVPADPAHAHTPLDHLRGLSCQLYPQLSVALRERTGIDNGYAVCGGIELPESPSDVLPTEEWHAHGATAIALDAAALYQREPLLAPGFSRGALLPDMAQIRNPWHLRALEEGCRRQGVEFHPRQPVLDLQQDGSRITQVGHGLSAGRYLIAAGAWSETLLRQVGHTFGIRPIRGEIALFDTGRVGFRPILLQGKRYLVSRGDGKVLAGSTEADVGFDNRPTAPGVAGLVDFAVSLVPSLADAYLETSWAGLRPGSPDGLPFLGRLPNFANLFVAAGHFRAGLQLAPATGLAMARLLLDQAPPLALEAFRVDRPPPSADA